MTDELERYMDMLDQFSAGMSKVIAVAVEDGAWDGVALLLDSIRATQAILELNAYECESALAR